MFLEAVDFLLPLHAQAGDAGDPILARLFDEDLIVPMVAIVCGTLIAIVAISFTMIRTIVVSRAKEQSRRELAAYVAEGTLDADKAISLLEAGKPVLERGEGKAGC